MSGNREYQVVLTQQARKLVKKIKDRREQQLLLAKLEKLKYNPNLQGNALVKELSNYRSVRARNQYFKQKIESKQYLLPHDTQKLGSDSCYFAQNIALIY